MKKKIFLLTLSLVFTVASSAQIRTFDNFDTSAGVKIVSSKVKPSGLSKRSGKRKSISNRRKTRIVQGIDLNALYRKTEHSKLANGSPISLKGVTTGDALIDSYIVDSGRRYKVDPLLIYAQMYQESAFKKRARSYKGARGLMQLMPSTARRFGIKKIYDPKQNIDAGVRYMRWLLNKFDGDVVLALAGYNAGEGAVMRYGWQVPPYRETKEYVRRIAAHYKKITKTGYAKSNLKKEKLKSYVIYKQELITVTLPNGRKQLVTR